MITLEVTDQSSGEMVSKTVEAKGEGAIVAVGAAIAELWLSYDKPTFSNIEVESLTEAGYVYEALNGLKSGLDGVKKSNLEEYAKNRLDEEPGNRFKLPSGRYLKHTQTQGKSIDPIEAAKVLGDDFPSVVNIVKGKLEVLPEDKKNAVLRLEKPSTRGGRDFVGLEAAERKSNKEGVS